MTYVNLEAIGTHSEVDFQHTHTHTQKAKFDIEYVAESIKAGRCLRSHQPHNTFPDGGGHFGR